MGNFTRLRLFSRIQRLRNDRRIFSCLLWTVLKRATARDQKTYRQNYSCEWVHVLICVRFRTRKIRSWRRTSGWTWCVPNLSASIAATSSRMLLKLPTNFLQSVAVTIQYKRKFLKSIFSKLWPFGGLPIKGYENLRFFTAKGTSRPNLRRLNHFVWISVGGLASRSGPEKSQEVTRGSHRNHVLPLTQGLSYRAACDVHCVCIFDLQVLCRIGRADA